MLLQAAETRAAAEKKQHEKAQAELMKRISEVEANLRGESPRYA